MMRPLQFDCQSQFGAVEVENEETDRNLPPELAAPESPVPEPRPQPLFRTGGSSPHLARKLTKAFVCSSHSPRVPRTHDAPPIGSLPVCARPSNTLVAVALLGMDFSIATSPLRPSS